MEAPSKDLIDDDVTSSGSQQQEQGTTEDDKRMDPFPTDSQHLLKLLPEEVWRVILESVDNNRDYSRISEASPVFQDLLSERKNQALFPEVLKIMMEKVKDKDRQEILTTQDLASLRQVCRFWKKGVDRLLSHVGPYKPGNFTTRFYQLADFQRFQNHFASTHCAVGANPFPARSVGIYLTEVESEQEAEAFYIACLDLLRRYGKHIWDLEIGIRSEEPAHLYTQLKHMLALLPKLKYLHFVNLSDDPTMSEQELQSLLASPFPTLPDLKLLWHIGMHMPIMRHLLINASSLLWSLGLIFNDEEEFRQFSATPFPTQVTQLWLVLTEVLLDWPEIFSAVETQFGETLTHLGIELPNETVPFRKEDRLTLPKLKKLDLKFYRPVSLDFLLGLESTLDELRITIEPDEEALSFERVVEEEEQDIKLYSHIDQLEGSNIWEKLPRLKMLKVHWGGDRSVRKTCTRSMWKDWIKKNQTV